MRWISFLFAASLAGCSCLTQFDPNTQPCDSVGACLPGYTCLNAVCVFTDAGTSGCTPACSGTDVCLRNQCFALACGTTTCASGAVCVNGQCTISSCAGVSCDASQLCVSGVCQPKLCGTGMCTQGQACMGGTCTDVSCQGLTCPSGQRCAQGACVACAARETNCTDGRDDDCDLTIDCADADCANLPCDDGDGCTTSEFCQGGACRNGQPRVCNTPGACELSPGFCDAGTCFYSPQADGTTCGSNASDRCCQGQCVNLTLQQMNCGGCGLACASGATCTPINLATCGTGPAGTSGRCGCNRDGGTPGCPMGQTCNTSSYCVPALPANCATGQSLGSVSGCGNYCRYP